MNEPETMTALDVAEILQLPYTQVLNLVATGELPGQDDQTGTLLIKERDFALFIAACYRQTESFLSERPWSESPADTSAETPADSEHDWP